MELPPGPGAPPLWQTIAWMARPAAFMRRIHERHGDPVTIRTYWTEQPMVLFSNPDAAREIFGQAFIEHYAATRQWEWRQSQSAVTSWEMERYFEII